MVFKAGDKVKFGEYEGIVTDFGAGFKHDFLFFEGYSPYFEGYSPYGDRSSLKFDSEGRLLIFPNYGCVLTLIERPKQKVKKSKQMWVNIFNKHFDTLHPTQSAADEYSQHAPAYNRVACVPVTLEWEE